MQCDKEWSTDDNNDGDIMISWHKMPSDVDVQPRKSQTWFDRLDHPKIISLERTLKNDKNQKWEENTQLTRKNEKEPKRKEKTKSVCRFARGRSVEKVCPTNWQLQMKKC